MSKIIFVSNRLPVTVKTDDERIYYEKSIGGLATGLKSYHENADSVWVGWPGIEADLLSNNEKATVRNTLLKEYQCMPVHLSNREIDMYYHGFCNKTIWPLFHYFMNKTEYHIETWQAYQSVNAKFLYAVEQLIEDGDTVWIHDYQLMLLPKMIKDKYPNTKIGFFLHIPFPSYELFRLLIWRESILHGILGADLIGFHTYGYVRHFLSTVRRLLGLENNLNRINYENRYVLADAFPMGIDYDRFANETIEPDIISEVKEIFTNAEDTRMIVSIDRLDYTKGIPERIRAYARFLELNPQYHKKVRLNLIVAPSRVEVESYGELRREITELVSEINGKFGTVNWMPVWYYFQSFSQEELIAFYRYSDVLLVTPLRDGMNLVVKEYIASRSDLQGMVVISETAGAASELSEAVVVNPNDIDAIAQGIKKALEMDPDEKASINKLMHKRLKRYNVDFWASEFLKTLEAVIEADSHLKGKDAGQSLLKFEQNYKKAKKRLFLLDYDGTLVGFKLLPQQAKPDEALKELLKQLTEDKNNTVAIVSGRDHVTLDQWLGGMNLHLLAAHGLWLKHPGEEWTMSVQLENDWKESIHHIMEVYMDRLPGSLIEEKDYSLAFHYRQSEPDMAAVRISELREALMGMTLSMSLAIQEGNKVLEVKDSRVNKGYASSVFLQDSDYDFVFAVGDDYTDEDLFRSLPTSAISVKVGLGSTSAKYFIKSWKQVRKILAKFV